MIHAAIRSGIDSGAAVDSEARFVADLPEDLLVWPRVRSRGEERAMMRLTHS
jgi:hypothetical protein